MKRLVSALLTCMMLISVILPAAAAKFQDTAGTPVDKAVQIVTDLGLMKGYDDGTFRAEENITRAELASLGVKLLSMDDVKAAGQDKFIDVPPTHWAHDAIYTAVSAGLMSGTAEDAFTPDAAATYEQALTVIVNALGYRIRALAAGGFPAGYFSVAGSLGLTSGVGGTPGEAVTRGQLAKAVYNALSVELLQEVGSGSRLTYETYRDQTLLSERMDIYRVRGVVTDNGVTALSGASRIKKNQIAIDSVSYLTGDVDARGLLGYAVEAYFKDDRGVFTLVSTVPDDRKNEATELKAEELRPGGAFGKTEIRYDKGSGRAESISISGETDFIYNGKSYPQITPDELAVKNGGLTLLDNNSDGTAEVVFVHDGRDMYVSTYAKTDGLIYDERGFSLDISEEGNDKFVSIQDTAGNPAAFKDIKEGILITGYASKDSKCVRVVINAETAVGKVESYETIGAEHGITLDGAEYRFTEAYYAYYNSTAQFPAVGDTIKAFLNAAGKIAYVLKDGGAELPNGEKYGYVVKGGLDASAISDQAQFRIFTADGTFTNFKTSEKLRRSNEKGELVKGTGKELYTTTFVSDGVFVPQLIRYTLNADGELQTVKTAVTDPELVKWTNYDPDVFTLSRSMRQADYSDVQYDFMDADGDHGLFVIRDATVVFGIPTPDVDGSIDEDQCTIMTKSIFQDNTAYKSLKAYDCNSLGIMGALVSAPVKDTYSNTHVMVLEKIMEALDAYGDQAHMLSGWYEGTVKNVSITQNTAWTAMVINPDGSVSQDVSGSISVADLKKGDILKLDINDRNEAVSVNRLVAADNFTSADPVLYTNGYNGNGAWPRAVCFMTFGKVYDKDSYNFTTSVDNGKTLLPHRLSSETKFYLIDTGRATGVRTIAADSMADMIASAKNYSGGEMNLSGSIVFCNKRYGRLLDLVIIK